MSDTVKKVRIKKEDGTFTNYIPIGADAKDISINYNNSDLETTIKKKPYYYNNIIDMKSDTSLREGDMVITLGYYEANDGGSAEYKIVNGEHIDNGGSYHQISNDLFAELIVKNEINVKQFGAKGDNNHDDTVALQTAINYAILIHSNCFFPYGTYLISETLVINTSGILNDPNIRFFGTERQSTTIKAKSESNITRLIDISATSEHARNISISNFYLHGNNIAQIGINIVRHISESFFKNIKIQSCTQYGLKGVQNFYLTTLDKITVYNSQYGIYIYGGINTSLNIKDCYCNNCTYGYKISGIYNTMQNCCADGSSALYGFDLSGFRGTLIGCGGEASNALKFFYATGGTGNITIVGAYSWGNFDDEEAIHIDAGNSIMTFVGGYVAVNWNDFSYPMPGMLYKHGPYGAVNFIDTKYSKYTLSNNGATDRNNSCSDTYINRYGMANIRGDWSRISFIGIDGFKTGLNIDNENINKDIPSNAIFFGLGDSKNSKADGTDIQWSAHNSKGDILLSRNPENIGGIGWIQSQDYQDTSTANWKNGTYYKIPVIYASTTSKRITIPEKGQMMFDTTLGKPIWYNGTNWVDANGNNVDASST